MRKDMVIALTVAFCVGMMFVCIADSEKQGTRRECLKQAHAPALCGVP